MPTSRTEQLARDLLSHYQPRLRQVHNYRPEFLRNPETGFNLELDIWLPDINAALEISGIQHGRFIPGLQRSFAAFEKQQRHDALKIQRCQEQGITLYRLTVFDLTQPRFAPWYTQFVIRHGLKLDRYVGTPHHLFAEAERLSRQKAPIKNPKRSRRPGLLPLLKRLIDA